MSILTGGTFKGALIRSKFSSLPSEYTSLALDLDFLNTSSITFNGSNIAQINDASGQGRHFSQATASSQPLYSAGVGATFNSDFLQCTSNIIADSTGTIIFVIRFDRDVTEERFFSQGFSTVGDGNDWQVLKNANNTIRTALRVGTTHGLDTVQAAPISSFVILTVQKDAAYINTSVADIVMRGSLSQWFNSAVGDRIVIGRTAGSVAAFANVTLKRISYFNARLSNGEVISLTNGLKQYYNI